MEIRPLLTNSSYAYLEEGAMETRVAPSFLSPVLCSCLICFECVLRKERWGRSMGQVALSILILIFRSCLI